MKSNEMFAGVSKKEHSLLGGHVGCEGCCCHTTRGTRLTQMTAQLKQEQQMEPRDTIWAPAHAVPEANWVPFCFSWSELDFLSLTTETLLIDWLHNPWFSPLYFYVLDLLCQWTISPLKAWAVPYFIDFPHSPWQSALDKVGLLNTKEYSFLTC